MSLRYASLCTTRANPSKYAGTAIDAAAKSTWVPALLIGGGLAGLLYAFTRSASAATPPAATPGKTTEPPSTAIVPAHAPDPELPLPNPLVQPRPITLLGQRVDPAVAIMQAQLSALGFGSLKHDGVSGTATRAATGAFLVANRLDTPAGMIDFVNRSHVPVDPSSPAAVLYAVDWLYRQARGLGSGDTLGSVADSSGSGTNSTYTSSGSYLGPTNTWGLL